MPLESARSNCPADWDAAMADSKTFCAERKMPMYDVSLSTDACRGQLHYTRHLFDGGPRSCLYDPITKKLTGYGAFDGKANHSEQSCGPTRADFDEQGCAVTSCPK